MDRFWNKQLRTVDGCLEPATLVIHVIRSDRTVTTWDG